ncbi:MAG: hypothetical protein H6830_07285 [Planctomycetes bacterium]|nr:hypothetical protein [Planctomycetota bacterium]MCB9910202.1 hypothetical protein [Planctomycetota bacterium]HPF14852.1 hypothetical protein [Planctomycetota bacterium]
MVSTLVVFAAVSGLLVASSALSTVEVKQSQHSLQDLQASSIAEAGIEMGKLTFDQAAKRGTFNPIDGIAAMFGTGNELELYQGAQLTDDGGRVGAYSARATVINRTPTSIELRIDSTGYWPDAPANLPEGRNPQAWNSQSVTLRYALESSQVFNYGYFINNWGWLYGNTITMNGNARSNGQFDAGGYKPTINGSANYDEISWNGAAATLSGYQDDNGDGLEDGQDGGVFSGWDIVGADHVRGSGGNTQNQHDFEDQVPMPNLSDLSMYEDVATDQGGTISIGSSVVVNGVLGDDSGEMQHLYLEGTLANPIVLNGPVVVRGDVIIKGYVTGKGVIYSGGNTYVPDSIHYVNGPTSLRPTSNSQAATEAWLTDNWDKDFLGLFSAENVVVGDFTSSTWRSYVSSWMSSSMNRSAEDAGEDGIPNTYAGRDGIVGTSDDDVLEGDGQFTVEYYSAADLALGVIPPGFSVGDVIPGSGEDIDGDGQYDGTTTLADLDFQDELKPTKFAGNMPAAGISNYKDIASMYANNLDATLYTNHSFCFVVLGSQPARINGAMVARNENIIYGTPTFETNYDARLLGGGAGQLGLMLPRTLAPVEVLQWRHLDEDPLRNMVGGDSGEVTP